MPSRRARGFIQRILRLLNRELSAMNAVIALKASGFPYEDIKPLTWRDIELVAGHTDFANVHIRRDYAAVSKHDFSRPMIPDSALYMHRFYKYLLDSKSEEELADTTIRLGFTLGMCTAIMPPPGTVTSGSIP